MPKPVTVVETPEFLAAAKKLLSGGQRAALVSFLAHNPKSGDLMQGTGGLRKVRWALAGKGKSGGVRVIHFFHDEDMPLFVLTVYPKSGKDNLSADERNGFRKLTQVIARHYRKKP